MTRTVADISVSWRESPSQPWKRVAGGFNTELDARRWTQQYRLTNLHLGRAEGRWLVVINPNTR